MSLASAVRRVRGHGDPPHDEQVRCPADDWIFPPRYTEGRCPLCGWVPEEWSPPRDEELRAWMWRLVLCAVAVSAVVLWLTLAVYQRP